MTKIIEGFIKFYIVYMLFGTLGLIILYASADLKCLIQTGESFFQELIHTPDAISEEAAIDAIQNFLSIALKSVPGDTFFETVLGISFDSNISAGITSIIIDLFQSGETMSVLAKNLQNYDLFWRDMSVAACASLVLYAVVHLKTKIAGRSISVWLGFALSSVWWILASYTFAETITYALEVRVKSDNLTILYIIITATAILLEATIHAYGGKCSALRLVVLLCFKILLNLLRSAFVLYMCVVLASFFGIENSSALSNIYIDIFGLTVSGGVVICTVLIEGKITDWSEKVLE